MQIRQVAAGLVLGMICGWGWHCDSNRAKRRSPSSDRSSNSTSEQASKDAGDGDRNWLKIVRQRLDASRSRTSESSTASENEQPNCTFFPESCGEGLSCFSTADGVRRCATYDPNASEGDPCRAANDCPRGHQCVGELPGTCRALCDPDRLDDWGCRSGYECVRVRAEGGGRRDWGVCRPIDNRCTLWPDDSCELGENCYRTPIGRRCRAYDFRAEVGDSCPNGSTDCNGGQVCIELESGRVCRPKCDDEHPCDSGSCQPVTDRPFGYCAPSKPSGNAGRPRETSSEETNASDTTRVQGW